MKRWQTSSRTTGPSRRRLIVVVGFMLIAFLTIAVRVIYLQCAQHEFLQQQGDARVVRWVKTPAYRGIITDRRGDPLAVTTPIDSVWMNPKILPHSANLAPLARLLGVSSTSLASLRQLREKNFVYIKRHISPAVRAKVAALNIQGINLLREYRRYYPTGPLCGHVVGFTNIDDVGQEGLELAFDQWLRGQPGTRKVLRDRMGRSIADVEHTHHAVNGKRLVTSIDRRIQYVAYKALQQTVHRHNALGGSIVILDVRTGEVLAMVNQPAFNPNNRADFASSRVRNRAVTDVFEPGSVIKPISVLAGLAGHHITADTVVDTSPGHITIDGKTVKDSRDYGRLDLVGILKKSSNVGITKIIARYPMHTLTDTLAKLGFGQVTEAAFPGERAGHIATLAENDQFSRSTLAFGYGLSTTALQLASAYAAIGHGGVKQPVSLLKVEDPGATRAQRVVAAPVAKQVLAMMRAVVTSGSGRYAKVPGYHVAGKTGTVRKIGPSGYVDSRHRAVFAGLIPATRPRLAAVVIVDEPSRGGYYGSLVAAPLFARVMTAAVRLLNIAPDDLDGRMVS